MEERAKKHKTNLISLAVTCFAIGGLNFHLFVSGNMMLVAFNLMYFILGMGCLYSRNLISSNLKKMCYVIFAFRNINVLYGYSRWFLWIY